MMKLDKKAFTLTELLIALGVIGVLTAILLPIVRNLLPDQNALMAKRVYYSTQTAVAAMINNEKCYPDLTDVTSDDERRIGFDDGYPRPNCVNWAPAATDEKNADGTYKEKDACEKFVTLFKKSLDVDTFYGTQAFTSEEIRFKTRDGVAWDLQCQNRNNTFTKSKNNPSAYVAIYVDVNGKEKPNRINLPTESRSTISIVDHNVANESGKSSYDSMYMEVYATGKIKIMDEWAQEVVDVSKDVTGI